MKNVAKVFLVVSAILKGLFGLIIIGLVIINLCFLPQYVGIQPGTNPSIYSVILRYYVALSWLLVVFVYGAIHFVSVIICPISYSKLEKEKNLKKIKTLGAFNIVFGSLVGGILMLCMKEKNLE